MNIEEDLELTAIAFFLSARLVLVRNLGPHSIATVISFCCKTIIGTHRLCQPRQKDKQFYDGK